MTRAEIVASPRCPRCGATPGMPCQEDGKRRPAVHAARVGLAEATVGWRDGAPGPDRATKTKWREGRHGRR